MLNPETKPKVFTKQQALLKAMSFCAYQERSQHELRNKLYEWGLHQTDVEIIISEMIENNFLNEERFALAYALGKFRIKGWGKIKIKQGLKWKKVPEKLIQKSLNQIEEEAYLKTLSEILMKKSALINEKDPYKRRYKLMQYAASRGFEPDLISDLLKNNQLG